MKKSSTVFLQVVLVLTGIGAAALLLWEPQLEGRNVNATLFEIYFKDAFLAYVYLSSIAFFVALYKAFKILGYIRQNKTFSQVTVNALRTIKYCAMTIIAALVGAEAYIFLVQRGNDDIAGGVMMGLMMIFVSSVVATAAAVFEKTTQSAVDMKSENDLTV